MRLGAHLSIAKGLENAAKTAEEIKANTFQFTRNPRGELPGRFRGGNRKVARNTRPLGYIPLVI